MAEAADIELIGVVKRYGVTTAVDGINLKISGGSYCCLLGPSGCGKTTTLRLIAGHERLSGGDILVGDQVMNDLSPARRGSAMMFQNYALFPHLNCADNVAFSLKSGASARRNGAPRRWRCWSWCTWRPTRSASPHSFPVASSSGWPWPAR